MRREALIEQRDAIVGAIAETLRLNRRGEEAEELIQAIHAREQMRVGPMSQIRFALAWANTQSLLRPGYDLAHKPLAEDYRMAKP